MSEKQVLEELRQRELKILFERAEKIVQDKTYRHLKGMRSGRKILSFDVDKDHYVYIDLCEKSITLVTARNLDWKNYSSLEQINILHNFFTLFEDLLEKNNNQSFWRKLFTFGRKSSSSSIILFRQAETSYYKSILSGRILSLCYHDDHSYTFRLSDDRLLHIALPGRYLTDEGTYRLEKPLGGTTKIYRESECAEEILEAIKHLVDHEEVLRAAK